MIAPMTGLWVFLVVSFLFFYQTLILETHPRPFICNLVPLTSFPCNPKLHLKMGSSDFPHKYKCFLNWLICLEFKVNLGSSRPPSHQPLALWFYNTWSRTKLVLLQFLPPQDCVFPLHSCISSDFCLITKGAGEKN